MIEFLLKVFIIYIIAINLVAMLVVIYDKAISKRPRGSIRRIPERTFVSFSALGGGIGTLFTMLWIRHKTKSHNGLLFKIGFFAFLWIIVTLLVLR